LHKEAFLYQVPVIDGRKRKENLEEMQGGVGNRKEKERDG